MSKIKQFVLTNSDEIICEVLDQIDTSAVIIRGALRIINVDDPTRGITFFAMRPWMSLEFDPETLQTLNTSHIIGEVKPSEKTENRYAATINKIKKYLKIDANNLDIDQILEELPEDATDQEFDDYIDHLIHGEHDDSSLGENVIKFKPKETLH